MSDYFEEIVVGPLPCEFSNENKAMGLRPHRHYAEVTMGFTTLDDLGFPVFEETVNELRGLLREYTAQPFRDATNEAVLRRLFHSFAGQDLKLLPAMAAWDHPNARWRLDWMELAVQGVKDDIGHDPSMTRYRVRRAS